MGLAVRRRTEIKDREVYEVGVINLYGAFRIEDFWSPVGGATKAECEEFIERANEALKEIGGDILNRRKQGGT